jgi:hypothetical protein
MTLDQFFDWAWTRYLKNTPRVKQIVDLLIGHGETIVNDHIALRTLDHPAIKAQFLAKYFIRYGYEEKGEYEFPAKKVRARHYEKPGHPKVFISELITSEFDPKIQKSLNDLVAQIPEGYKVEKLFVNERPWDLDTETYKKLAEVSEYASWVAAWGFEPNHFTVLVNELKTYNNLPKLNELLKYNGFELNTSGGEIKGSPQVYLEQSSIMAEKAVVKFSDGELEIPSCYYEFAYRYPLDSGELYEGFVAASADKIFESTDDLGK